MTAAGETRPGTECDRSVLYGAPVVDREDPLDVFASARISVPGALIGALPAEWPATGQGIGSGMLTLIAGFRYAEMWASVVLVTDEGEAGPIRGHQLGPASVVDSGCRRRHRNGPAGDNRNDA